MLPCPLNNCGVRAAKGENINVRKIINLKKLFRPSISKTQNLRKIYSDSDSKSNLPE